MTEKKIAISEVDKMKSLKGLRFDMSQFKGVPENLEFEIEKVKTMQAYKDGAPVDGKFGKVFISGRDPKIIEGFKNLAGTGMDEDTAISMMASIAPLSVTIYDEELIERFVKNVTDIGNKNLSYAQINNIRLEIIPKWTTRVTKNKNTGYVDEQGAHSELEIVLAGYETLTELEESTEQRVIDEINA